MTQLAVIQPDRSLANVYESAGMLPPSVKVAMATDWANSLMAIVEARKLYQVTRGKKYLQVEAWVLIGAFDETTASGRYEPIIEDGEIVGYKGIVDLIRRGERVGGAEASCSLQASVCTGRQGKEKDRAAQSASQTWAASKAFKLKYSYVAVLAGFEPTPAEEMQDPTSTADVPRCPKHNRYPAKVGKDGSYFCSSKVGKEPDGRPIYCEWKAPGAPSTSHVTPEGVRAEDVLVEVASLVQELGWDRATYVDWMAKEGFVGEDGKTLKNRDALPSLRLMDQEHRAGQETTEREPDDGAGDAAWARAHERAASANAQAGEDELPF